MKTILAGLAALGLSTISVLAESDTELRTTLDGRLKGDRTGACVAAAVIDTNRTATAYVCADPKSQRPYDEHTALEIGSVTKTMTAALLAELIVRGDVSLGDPIAKLLPPGTSVPSFQGRQITIGDIVTHTSGLPSIPPQLHLMGPINPYASVTERALLGALATTQLTYEPGTRWQYSNFAMMVLSYALAKRSGKTYEALLRERLLIPLGMDETYIAKPPPHVHLAQGHLSNGLPAAPWDFPAEMAGVGGVRATLPDMVRYLEGELGLRESEITPALARTQQQVVKVGRHTMGMNWMLATVNGHSIDEHEGGTGGYSSFVAFDREAKRAVVLLSDTALTSVGDFSVIGRHVLDPSLPVGAPHTVAIADTELIDALVGRYRLQGGLTGDVRRKGSALAIQVDGQPEFELGYDNAGDFYPLQFDAVLRPKLKADGTYSLTWFQGGGALTAERLSGPAIAPAKWTPTEAEIKEYEGDYPLTHAFSLRVFSSDGKLFVQSTGQRALAAVPVKPDTFVAENVGAQFDFERDDKGKVCALVLRQRGQVFHGGRH